ncbi:hypothetical protein GEMRC1_005256 [Eukaryota sp. GEM-RC1]
MYFNNSLTFSLTHLNLLAVSATCFPGSELVIDSSSFDKGLLDIEYQIHLTSNCSLTSLLPVQSTGIIIVANDSVMTLYKDFSTTNKTIVFPKGELELRHSNITFEESDLYLHPDLFLYYNWVTSSNRIDLSGNHDSSDILIHGPEWKTDDIGGYLEIKLGDTLHIPNIPGTQGWVGASISVWIYWETGIIGFNGEDFTCRFHIHSGSLSWGQGWVLISTLPLHKWFHLVITFDHAEARVYVDGKYHGSFTPELLRRYRCDSAPNSFFLAFRTRFTLFTKTLTTFEINLLTFDLHARIWGQGKLSLVNLEMMISSHTFGVQKISLVSSTIYLDHCELYYTASGSESKLVVDSLYLTNTSSIITNASLVVSNFHCLLTVSATCFPGSELIIDSSSIDESLLEVPSQLQLTSHCSLTSLLPVQSTGIIAVEKDSIMRLFKNSSTINMTVILVHGELVLKNSTTQIEESDLYLHPDLFLYYNWVTSSNRIDLSGNHDSSDIIIDGPKWKTDDIGGYLDVQPDLTLHIPNIPGEFGWREASISLWIYFEEGGIGFDLDNSCAFYITTTSLLWGGVGSTRISLPLEEWFHLVITFDQSTAHVYVDGNYDSFLRRTSPYECFNDIPSYFPLSEIEGSSSRFKGRIRAVQFFTKTLTLDEIEQLNFDIDQGILGQGHLSFVDSNVEFRSSQFYISSLSLLSSTLQSNNVIFKNLKNVALHSESIMTLSQNSEILSDYLTLTLNSSELYYDDSTSISSSTIRLIAVNSRFQNDFDFDNIDVLDLSFSTFESPSDTQIIVGYFSCFHCQILGNSPLSIETHAQINSGNFSSSLAGQESLSNFSISGSVQLTQSFDCFSHVILDDVSVSQFQSSSSGSIRCHADVVMRNDVHLSDVTLIFNDKLIFVDATFLSENLFKLFDFQNLTRFGTIDTNFENSGIIHPSSTFTFNDNLSLAPFSIVSLQIKNDSSTQLIVGSTAYLDGILVIDFDTQYDSTGSNYTLVESGQINGRFSTIINPCASLITTVYSKTSLIVSVNDFIANLNRVSYISTTGYDDPCCGSFNCPCASFKGILKRMGPKGKVYLHQGNYLFHQELGKLKYVDWEVIGMGDVIIEGMDATLFEIVRSNLSLSNVDVLCSAPLCFSVVDSTFELIHSNIYHEVGDDTLLVDTSTVFLSNCSFESNSSSLLRSSNSQLVLENVSVSGSFQDSVFILEKNQLDVAYNTFSNIESSSLFQLRKSDITLFHSFCSNSNFTFAVFDLTESEISQNGLSFESVATSIIFSIKSSVFIMNHFIIPSSISFDQFLLAETAEIMLNDFNLLSFNSLNSVFFVSNSKIDFQKSVFQDINCKSLLESVNSLIELKEMTLSNVTCDTCFDILKGNFSVQFLDIFDASETIFQLIEVDVFTVNFLDMYDSYLETVILAQKTTLECNDFTVYHSTVDKFLHSMQSVGTFQRLFFESATVTQVFTLTEDELLFSDFILSNMTISRVFHVYNSVVELYDFYFGANDNHLYLSLLN